MQVEFGPEGCDLEIGYVSDGTVKAAKDVCGDCCVFCSYGDVKCPPIQQGERC